MPFNFNNNNLFSILNQYNQFKKDFLSSGKDPLQELEKELKQKNISQTQLNELINSAKQLEQFGKIFGIHS